MERSRSGGVYTALAEAVEKGHRSLLVTVVDGPPEWVGCRTLLVDGKSVYAALPGALHPHVDELVRRLDSARGTWVETWPVPSGQAVRVAIELYGRPPHVIIAGAGHIAQPLCRICKTLGYTVTVLDDRAQYATAQRFPEADEVVVGQFGSALEHMSIDESSHVVVITRGHLHDMECLWALQRSRPAYVGMIGSKRRVLTVREALLRDGYPEDALARIYAPIGLDIGAETPEEIALAIAAEIVNVKRGGRAPSLQLVRP